MKQLKALVYNHRLNRLQSYFNSKQLEKPALIISGSPRGGTTWVFEVLQKTNSVFGLWEPLHPEIIHEFYPNKSFKFHKYIEQHAANEEMHLYLKSIVEGDFINNRLLQKNTKFKSYKKQDQLLVKFCRLSPMLTWFSASFKQQKILQLYRNPLAVVSSQMKHGAWQNFDKNTINKLVSNQNYNPTFYKQFDTIFSSINYPEEILASVWALDMLPTLAYKADNLLKIKYENLFVSPEENFSKIYRHFKLPIPPDLNQVIKKPSSTTKEGSNILTQPAQQLETWKKHLDKEQASRVRKILSKFGFDKIGDVEYDLSLNKKIIL